jgi:dynein heavy chain
MVMTETLEMVADSLYNNTVPKDWMAIAYPSLMPLAAWFNDLLARSLPVALPSFTSACRISFLQNWIDHGIPTVFWISGFFFPQAFLAGTLQNFARKTRKAIDTISLATQVVSRGRTEECNQPSRRKRTCSANQTQKNE